MSEKKEYNKWKSRRWIITLWSMITITLICTVGIIFKTDSYVPIATALVAIPVAFTSLETLNKKDKYKNKTEGEA